MVFQAAEQFFSAGTIIIGYNKKGNRSVFRFPEISCLLGAYLLK